MKVYVIKAESYNNDNTLMGSHIFGVADSKKTAEFVANEYMDVLEKIGYRFEGCGAVCGYLPRIVVSIKSFEVRI